MTSARTSPSSAAGNGRSCWSCVITLAATGYFSYRQTPLFRSSATVYVKPLNPDQLFAPTGNFGVSMKTEQTLAGSPAVKELAAQEATDAGVTSADTGSLTPKAATDTTFLAFTYSAPDAQQAKDWAHAYAMGYMDYRTSQAKTQFDSAQKSYQEGINRLSNKLIELRSQYDAAKGDDEGGAQERDPHAAEQSQRVDEASQYVPLSRSRHGRDPDRRFDPPSAAVLPELDPQPSYGAARGSCARVRGRLHPRATRRPVRRSRGPRGGRPGRRCSRSCRRSRTGRRNHDEARGA